MQLILQAAAGYKCHVLAQALLEGISLSQPQPKIPSELIRFLGKTYSAWHIAIPLLESHVMLFPMARANSRSPTATPCFRASEPSGLACISPRRSNCTELEPQRC